MAERRVAPRFGDIFASRQSFENAVFAHVRGDIHVYMKKGCTDSEHRILCHRSGVGVAGGLRCPVIYRIIKRSKTDGPGWRCVEAEALHSDKCTTKRRAELAAEQLKQTQAQERVQNNAQSPRQQQPIGRAQDAQIQARASLPTPPVSADPSTISLSPSLRVSPGLRMPLAAASSPLAYPALQVPGLSQNSQESTLTAVSQLQVSPQQKQLDALDAVPAPKHEQGLSAVDAARDDQPSLAGGSGIRRDRLVDNVALESSGEAGNVAPASIDEVQNAFAEASAALIDTKPAKPRHLSGNHLPGNEVASGRNAPQVASSQYQYGSEVLPSAPKPPLVPPSKSPLKTSTSKPTAPKAKLARAYSIPSSNSDEGQTSLSSSSAPEAADDEPYSPTKDVDDTVWSLPKHPKSAAKSKLEADVSVNRPRRTRREEIDRHALRSPEKIHPANGDGQRVRRNRRIRAEDTRTSFRDSGTAEVQRGSAKKNGPSASVPQTSHGRERHDYVSSTDRYARAIERDPSPPVFVASSRPPGSADSRHKRPRQYDGEERLQLPPGQKKRRSHIKEWVNEVAESVHGDSSPAQHSVGSHERTLASIEAFPKRVLATFHRLGYERISDLAARGVLKTDYPALIRHMMTLPPELSAIGDAGSFDEIEAWVAERRLMDL